MREILGSHARLEQSPTDKMLLARAVRAHHTLLVTLAESWLASGASAFTIWEEHLLFCWPLSLQTEVEKARETQRMHHTPLMLHQQMVGKIAILANETLNDTLISARLQADAALLAQLFIHAADLESARGELSARERLEVEMSMAAYIQRQLLPQEPPQVPGLDIFARCVPSLQVGGDFYHFRTHESRPFVLSVGDVSGKGLSAAFLMAMIRSTINNAARFMTNVHPRAILSRLIEDFYDDFTDLGMFATVFTACYNTYSRRFAYANAGHSPVIYCPVSGPARMLEADGPAVGALAENLSNNTALRLAIGDVLVIATDGFSEASNARGDMFGYERLLKLIEKSAHLSSASIGKALYRQVKQFTDGHEQSDDQTLVVVKGVEVEHEHEKPDQSPLRLPSL